MTFNDALKTVRDYAEQGAALLGALYDVLDEFIEDEPETTTAPVDDRAADTGPVDDETPIGRQTPSKQQMCDDIAAYVENLRTQSGLPHCPSWWRTGAERYPAEYIVRTWNLIPKSFRTEGRVGNKCSLP